MEPGVAKQPAVDLGGLVGRDVVDDEMDVELLRHAAVDEVQEPAELDSAVALDGVIGDQARRPRSRFVMESLQARAEKTSTPLADSG
jgi:hypothetical protein